MKRLRIHPSMSTETASPMGPHFNWFAVSTTQGPLQLGSGSKPIAKIRGMSETLTFEDRAQNSDRGASLQGSWSSFCRGPLI